MTSLDFYWKKNDIIVWGMHLYERFTFTLPFFEERLHNFFGPARVQREKRPLQNGMILAKQRKRDLIYLSIDQLTPKWWYTLPFASMSHTYLHLPSFQRISNNLPILKRFRLKFVINIKIQPLYPAILSHQQKKCRRSCEVQQIQVYIT